MCHARLGSLVELATGLRAGALNLLTLELKRLEVGLAALTKVRHKDSGPAVV